MSLLPIAAAHHAAGLSLVPVTTDGTKKPALPAWTHLQTKAAPLPKVEAWFGPHQALGVICGAVSGSLEMFELEGRAVNEGVLEQLVTALSDHGYRDLWDRLASGWVEVTPGGGFHWFYRVTGGTARPNTKLARRPATPDELAENPDEKIKVLIETRGEGGFVVLAPSVGHKTGGTWVALSGNSQTAPTLTADERDTLYAIASTFDQMPVPAPPVKSVTGNTSTGERPGDDYEARTDWADLLIPRGWTLVATYGATRTWRRPGKGNGEGISATTGRNDGDNLYVFSTSTEFEDCKPYSKFNAYTHLEHNGNWAAAAKALRAEGYGKPLEPSRPVMTDLSGIGGAATPSTSGNLATVHELAPRPTFEVLSQTLTHSDDGNALLLVEEYGDRIRYCDDRGRWLTWDGQRWNWAEKGGGKVREYAKEIARALPAEDKAEALHKKRSLGAIGTTAMLMQAHTDPRITVHLDDLDAHPYELNTPGGIVDLRTGQLRPPDPARLHTRLTACTPDADADTAPWREFLSDTFGDDDDLIGFLQRMIGYSAIGKVGPHVLPFCHGSGGNGKGVLLETVTKVLGDYATTTPSGFLMKQAHAKHETDIARLSGARMVLCSEVNEDDQFDEAKVKLLTGGDSLTARFMGRDHFTFTPTHQLWLMGNHKPAVRSGGRAFWRRLRLVGFQREVPTAKMVDDLQGLLATDHGPAILAWIVAGAASYHRAGLREPAAVLAATEDYAHDQDTVARFIEERCLLGGGTAVQLKVSLVREAYEGWCREIGEPPVTAKAFGLALAKRGIDSVKGSKGQRFYGGLSLLETGEETSWIG